VLIADRQNRKKQTGKKLQMERMAGVISVSERGIFASTKDS
jgi:hypothetical protein